MISDAWFLPDGNADAGTIGEAENVNCYPVWKSDLSVFCDKGRHQWEQKVQKATPDTDGRIYQACSICGEEGSIPLPKVSNIKLAGTSYTYTGKAIKPKVTVANAGEELSTDVYDVAYSNNTKVGTATVKVTLKGDYYKGTKILHFKITKAANPLKVKAKKATVKGTKKGKLKSNKTLKVSKVIKVTKKGKGKMSYIKSSGNKKITINKKTGKVTVKKGLKKGTYKIKVKVKAAGNTNFKASKQYKLTIKIKVK